MAIGVAVERQIIAKSREQYLLTVCIYTLKNNGPTIAGRTERKKCVAVNNRYFKLFFLLTPQGKHPPGPGSIGPNAKGFYFLKEAIMAHVFAHNRFSWSNVALLPGMLILFLILALPAFAGQASLAWDGNGSSATAGYMLHYGQSSKTTLPRSMSVTGPLIALLVCWKADNMP